MKPGELRLLTDAQLVAVAARCALRTEPWLATITDRARRAAADKAWRSAAAWLASTTNVRAADARKHARALQAISARVANAGDDEAGYALLTLSCACAVAADGAGVASAASAAGAQSTQSTQGVVRKRLVKSVIETGKYAASIAALCAHAGRVKPSDLKSTGMTDIVDGALVLVWRAAHADVEALVAGKPFRALGAKLWPKQAPRFWPK